MKIMNFILKDETAWTGIEHVLKCLCARAAVVRFAVVIKKGVFRMGSFIVPIQPMERMDLFKETEVESGAVGAEIPFQSVLTDAMTQLKDAQAVTNADSYRLALGDVDNLAQLQINAQKADAMLQTTVQLTTRVVNAYKEIMQMQI